MPSLHSVAHTATPMSQQPTLYLASDSLGCTLRGALAAHLRQAHPEFSVQDLGNFDKYYEAAYKVGGLVQQSQAQGGHDKAVLMCGTGQGMAIIANKFPGVYAAVVESVAAAGNAAAINNANVLTLGGMVLKTEDALAAVDRWLGTKFKEGYPDFEEFLEMSMKEIPTMLQGAAGAAAAARVAAHQEAA